MKSLFINIYLLTFYHILYLFSKSISHIIIYMNLDLKKVKSL